MSLKDLKNRIGSVKSTQKITKAMKMVAASKLRRAREIAEDSMPYANRMSRMLVDIASNLSPENAPRLMAGTGSDKTHLLVVVSADRGLCGGFNANISKAVKAEVNRLKDQGKEYKIVCIGKKAYEVIKLSHEKEIVYNVDGITKQSKIPFADAEKEAGKIIKMFNEGEFDVCSIFFNKFVSAIKQEVTKEQLIPLQIDKADNDNHSGAIFEFEPSERRILEDLIPRNLSVQFYYAFLESAASEQASRMTAMDNATRNAGEMIKKLTLVYNRTRQAQITKELIEIISGAEAL